MTAISRTIRTQFGSSTVFSDSSGSFLYVRAPAHDARKKRINVLNPNTIRPTNGLTDPPLNTRGHGQKAIHQAILQKSISMIAQKMFDPLLKRLQNINAIIPTTRKASPETPSTQSGT